MMSRVRKYFLHTFFLVCITVSFFTADAQNHSFDFYNGTFNFSVDSSSIISTPKTASSNAVSNFYNQIYLTNTDPLIISLKNYRNKYNLNDWIYYQLIRKTAEQISPKADNYFRYTLYKWYLLNKCGYDARIAVGNEQIIFYVRNDEDISDIPFFMVDGKKYMCLNYHDYGKLFKQADTYKPINIFFPEGKNQFSYKVTRMPDFKPDSYEEKDVEFSYRQKVYHFKLKVNENVKTIFQNYPVVDFETYFNIPLSRETYSSLIPILKNNLKGMDQKNGVDYLMRFTRYAFLYENDEQNFGKEKRLSPEQTLLNKYSDCDDRAGLFFFLVKEIYNLPMIALLYPTHLTMAVQFEKPVGEYIIYNGRKYSFCEPTPQAEDLKLEKFLQDLKTLNTKLYMHTSLLKGKCDGFLSPKTTLI